MKSGNILFSAVHFFVIFFILTVGVLFVVLPYADHFRILLINSLLSDLPLYQILGYAMIAASLLLFIGLYMLNRRRFFQIEMEASLVEVDKGLIQEMVRGYWKELFPGKETSVDIVISGKQSLEVVASLPEEREEDFFEQVQKELGSLLARQFGYQKPFTITLAEISR